MDIAATTTATGQIYVTGGKNFGQSVSTQTDFFDPSVNGWLTEPNLITGRRLHGSAVGGDGKIYVIGGANSIDTALATAEALVPTPIVSVSIQVGAGSNSINPNNPDTVQVYVLGSPTFNVSSILPIGVVFAGATMLSGTQTTDINGDGRNDLRFRFVTSVMFLPIGAGQACIGGLLWSGSYFKGCGTITLTATGKVWAPIASMSTARFWPAAATGDDGRVYVIGGMAANGTVLSSVEAYNPATNVWTTVASLPGPRYGHIAVKGTDGRIYVTGGYDASGALNTGVRYRVSTNTWSNLANNMSAQRAGFGGTLGTNGRIYVMGGIDGGTSVHQSAESYNTGTGTWTGLNNMPNNRYELAAATGSNGLVYAFGGWSDVTASDPSTTVMGLNTGTGNWATYAAMPVERAGMGAVADGSTILLIGGEDGEQTVNTTYGYSVTGNVWYPLRGMTSRRGYLAVALGLDGKIYAIGGWDGQNYLATAEVFATQYNPGVPLQPL
jgi:N-acetylneuraminic acid mutarotase